MVEFDWWYRNVIATARTIGSTDALQRAWVLKDPSITSAYDYDELAEQVLGDLRLEDNVHVFATQLQDRDALIPFTNFLKEFLKVNNAVSIHLNSESPQELLQSPQWSSLREAAQAVSRIPGAEAMILE